MAIDTSMYASLKPAEQPNMLQMFGQYAGLQNNLNQNRLFQAEFAAKQAQGQAALSSLNPDGSVNPLMYARNLQGMGSAGAFDANAAIQGAGTAASAQTQAQTAAQGLAAKQTSDVQNFMAPVALAPNPTMADVSARVQQAVQAGLITQDRAATIFGSAPSDPTQLKGWLKQNALLPALGPENAVTATQGGAPITLDNGPNISLVRAPGVLAAPGTPATVLGTVPKGLTPEANAALVPGPPTASGAPTSQTLAARLAAGGGPQVTGLAPGQAGLAEASAGRAADIQHAAASAPQRIAAMQSVRSVIQNVPSTAFGPTSELTSEIGKISAAFGIAPPKAVNGQASLEEINKSLNLIAAQQGAALHAGTDASRATVQASNPSLANSKEGLLRNLAVVQGNEQYGIAKNRALQDWLQTHPGGSSAQFEAMFNQKVSPLVFQSHFMTPDGRKEIWKTLSGSQSKDGTWGGEKGQFLKTLDFGQSHGWFEGQ